MKSVIAQYSMVSGEITPQLYGRPDYQRHQSGVELATGFIPLRYGALTRAPGTLERGRTKADAPARLISFKFAKNDTLTLEFTAGVMRIWRYGALVQLLGVPYELAIPYDWAAIQRLKWAQSYDVIYFTDGASPAQKLSRLALDNWTIAAVEFIGGPFDDANSDDAIEVQASAESGAGITLTATGGNVFTADDIGRPFYMKPVSQSTVALWTGNATVAVGNRMRYDGNTYEVTVGTNTKVNPPTHKKGVEKVDNSGLSWKHICGEFGVVTITAVASPTSATADVVETLPAGCVSEATSDWAGAAWSPVKGYPRAVAIIDRRLVFAGSAAHPRRNWFPELNKYQDHTPRGLPDSAFSYDVDGSETGSEILWLVAGRDSLFIGALGEVFRAFSTTAGEAIGLLNMSFELVSSAGAEDIRPIAVDGRPIFVGRGGQRVYELAYDLQNDAVIPSELSLPAEHLGQNGFLAVTWQSTPLRHFWFARNAGDLAAMVYDPREEVLGWCTVPVAGGVVEDVSVTYNADGTTDILTLIVRRVVDGQTRRYVEEMAPVFGALPGENDISLAEHFYCARTFDAPGGQTVFNLDHLEGETVYIWTELGPFTPQVVTGGAITLPQPVTRAHIGLFDATHLIRSLDLRAQAPDGSTLGRSKQMRDIGARLKSTAALETRPVAREFGKADKAEQWRQVGNIPVPSDLTQGFSGVTRVAQISNYGKEVVQEFRPVGGAPATLVNLAPMMNSEAE